jgi:chaperone required for assembly of F1-ATPase
MSEAPVDPIRAARAHMRQATVKRFYANVEVREVEGRHVLTLDGRGARTPARNALSATSRALMLKVAAEWERQRETIDPADIPLTRLLNAAIDGVARTMAETRAEIQRYAGSDLLCYRAEAPEALAVLQAAAWDPILRWAEHELGARFASARGVVPLSQRPEALERVAAAVARFDSMELTALHVMTTLTGSAILALALAGGKLSADEAWTAAHVDEDWQISNWGIDVEAAERRARRWTEMQAASRFLKLLRAG